MEAPSIIVQSAEGEHFSMARELAGYSKVIENVATSHAGQTVVTRIPASLLRDILRFIHLYDAEGCDLLKRLGEAETADSMISRQMYTVTETDSNYEETTEAHQHSRARLARITYELDLRRAFLPLEPSGNMRTALESMTFVGIIRLAQAADILDVGVVMDLCGVAFASFCYLRGRPWDVLRDDILAAIRTNELCPIVAEWPLFRRFENRSVVVALNAVTETEDVDVDIRAGLLAVSQHTIRNLERRRLHGNGGY